MSTHQPAASPRPAVVTIGVFDGVHRGHEALLGAARDQARERGLPLTVLTFDPHPLSVVRPDAAPCRLASLAHRVHLLHEAGADEVRVLPFDAALSHKSPREFVDHVLVDDLQAAAVVTGANFRFGHRAAGDTGTLRELGEEFGFAVVAVPLATSGDAPWSSTRIRELIRTGDVAGAAVGLGRPYRVSGEVVRGAQRGRDLGYPTANLALVPGTCVPADGVYAARAVLDPESTRERFVPAAVSVGANTTFGETEARIEAYLMEPGEWDLYGRPMALDFVDRIRGMQTFADASDLQRAMADDVARAGRILAGG